MFSFNYDQTDLIFCCCTFPSFSRCFTNMFVWSINISDNTRCSSVRSATLKIICTAVYFITMHAAVQLFASSSSSTRDAKWIFPTKQTVTSTTLQITSCCFKPALATRN